MVKGLRSILLYFQLAGYPEFFACHHCNFISAAYGLCNVQQAFPARDWIYYYFAARW